MHAQRAAFRPQPTRLTLLLTQQLGWPMPVHYLFTHTVICLGSCMAHLHGWGQQDDCFVYVLHLGQNPQEGRAYADVISGHVAQRG